MARYIASDLHTGNDISDYDKVMCFLELVDSDADEFLLLGDWLELFYSNLNIILSTGKYRAIVDKVLDIARKKPTRLITGNHDWTIELVKSYVEPVQIVKPFDEDGVYYCHGYEFDWLAWMVGCQFDPSYWKTTFPFLFPQGLAIWFINKYLGKEDDVYYWQRAIIHEKAAAFAREKGYHSVVFGHTHYPMIELRAGINLYNSGDMIDSYSYLVQNDGIIELRSL